MANDIYIGVPLIISLGIDIFFPYIFSLSCPKVWFAPPEHFCALVYLAICVLVGFTLRDAKNINNNDIFTFAWILLLFNLLWAIALRKHFKATLLLLFCTLLVAYFVYNEIFLSSLTDGENTTYLNLYSTLIVWLGFSITMVFDFASKKYNPLLQSKQIK